MEGFREELRKAEEEAEADAEAVLEEQGGQTAPRWHHRWILFPLSAVWRFIKRNGKRVGVTIAGFALILVGIALLVLPGPGWLVIFAGLALLSTEYVWAQRMLNKAKEQAQKAKDKVIEKKQARSERKAAKRRQTSDA
jgi:uncharacterized protein (TIGR02611 family)